MTEFPPRLAARFRPLRPLGEGGYGAVWLADQVELARPVAVKLLGAQHAHDEREVARFLDEARVTAALTHPAIVKVLDFGEEDGRPWIAYELLEGRTLSERLAQGPLAPGEVARAGAQVARGLVAAHAGGVLHRDIKPENLFQIASGAVKITDFGIAQWGASDRVKTATGVIVGSPAYIAPERVAGAEHSAASDVYALGVTLYELVTGAPPYAGDSPVQVLEQHMKAPVPRAAGRAPHVPRELDDAIAAMMAKDPAARPRAEDLASRLEALASNAVAAPPRSRPGPKSRGDPTVKVGGEERSVAAAPAAPAARARAGLAIGLAALAALALVVAWRASRTDDRALAAPGARVRVTELDVHRSASGVLVNLELVKRAALRIEVRAGDEAGRAVAAVDSPEGVWHQAVLDGLEPGSRYAVLVHDRQGAGVLTCRFETLAESVEKDLLAKLTVDHSDFGLAAAMDRVRVERAFLPPKQVAAAVRSSPNFGGGHALRLTVDVLSTWQFSEVAQAVLDQLGGDPKPWAPIVPLEMLVRRGVTVRSEDVVRWFPNIGTLEFFDQREHVVRLLAGTRVSPAELAERAVAARCEASERLGRVIARIDGNAARELFRTWLARDRATVRHRLAVAGMVALGGEDDIAAALAALPAEDAALPPYLQALECARTPAVRAALAARAATARPSADLIAALIRHRVTSALPRIVDWTRQGPPVGVRSAALCALALLAPGDAAALEHARRLVADEDPLIARAAAWAVGRARHAPALADLERLVASEDGDVHGLAAWALVQLSGRAGAQRVLEKTRRLIQAREPAGHLRAGVGYLAAQVEAPDLASALDAEMKAHPSIFLKTCRHAAKSAREARTERSMLLFPWLPLDRIDEVAGRGSVGEVIAWRVLARRKDEGFVHEPDRIWLHPSKVLLETGAYGPERRSIDYHWRSITLNDDGPLELTAAHRPQLMSTEDVPTGDLGGAVLVGWKHAGRLR
jgi:hypothetical protein